jgi:tRNA (guanine-N7-)-methyltransferase
MTQPLALPKLSSHSLPWPTDWDAIFGASRPLILEIGFGYGHFLEFLHQQHPEASIIGLEISNHCLVKAENAIARKGMHNVRVIHARAETALGHLFTPGSLSQVHVNFPDPWFKARHAGRRLMQRDTVDAIVNRLQPGGTLHLATDILAYAEMSAELLASTPGLTNTLDQPWATALLGRIMTKYERKARQAGRDCYYFVYRRNDQAAPEVPVIKELPMPHMVIQTPLTLQEMGTRFSPPDYADDERYIRFMKTYRADDSLLIEIHAREPTIDQRVALIVVARDQPGEYTLKLSAMGNPRPTAGLHKAVRLAGDFLAGLHPQSVIIHDKVRDG